MFGHDAHDFRDHVAGAAHDHGVADAHVEARDLVGVVQGRVGHGDAADEHRRQPHSRRRRAGAADVDLDRLDRGLLFLRRELVRDRPARRAADEAEFALAGEVVELVDDAVDVERQRVALLADARVVGETTVGTARGVDQLADRKSPLVQLLQRRRMRRRHRLAAFDHAERVGVERQRTLRGDARIELAQAAGGGVARIDQRLDLAVRRARRFVVRLEAGARHVDLAAHFQHLGPACATQPQRDRLDRAQVRGHVLAAFAVAARRAAHELAVFVAQADREAVEFRLDREQRVIDRPSRSLMRRTKSSTSSALNALPSDSIGIS